MNVHRHHATIGMISVLICLAILLSGAPFVLAQDVDEVIDTPVASSTPIEMPVNEVVSPYQTDGLSGGDTVVGDFVVGPGKVDLTIKPGESKTIEMTVANRIGKRQKFNITYEDAQGSQDTNTPIILLGDDRGPYSMKDYVQVPHTSFELDHNQRARIPVTITVPPDAEPGGLYGSVLIDTVALDAKAGDDHGTTPQSAIIARVGTLFFITIPGAVAKDGSLKEVTTVPKKLYFQSGPIPLGLLFENRGSIHLAPYGEMRIRNMFKEEVGSLELEPWFVFPKSLRLREVTWDREFLFGRYTVTAYINRSYDDVVDEMSYSFWVLPWKLLLGMFAVLFVIFFLIRMFFKKFEFKRKV